MLRKAQSCLQASEGLSLGRRNELTYCVAPRGQSQDQAVEFWTGEIQKDREDSISKSSLKRDTSGR